jgi:hypothetical protein
MPGESNISKTFTERTTKVVIVLILSTLFILPFLEFSTYYSTRTSFDSGFQQAIDLYYRSLEGGSGVTSADYQVAVQKYRDYHTDSDTPLFKLVSVPLFSDWESDPLDDFRTGEFEPFAGGGQSSAVAYRDI